MKLWTLVENTTLHEDLTPEHGLSLYIEAAGKRILFDMGASGAFRKNAEKMGVDLSGVDIAILSHGHADHGGGLLCFLTHNQKAPVYINQNAFSPCYNGEEKFIGLDASLAANSRIHYTQGSHTLSDGLYLYNCGMDADPYPLDTAGLTVFRDGALQPEDFRHEQYLLIEENGRRILISGCSHRGILNIMHRFRPDVLIGGFHYMKKAPNSVELAENARLLAAYPTVYYTCHCTGMEQFHAMKPILGDNLHYLHTGSIIQL